CALAPLVERGDELPLHVGAGHGGDGLVELARVASQVRSPAVVAVEARGDRVRVRGEYRAVDVGRVLVPRVGQARAGLEAIEALLHDVEADVGVVPVLHHVATVAGVGPYEDHRAPGHVQVV